MAHTNNLRGEAVQDPVNVKDPVKEAILKQAECQHALKFGEFTLKSGRKSPYFFNAADLNGGRVFEAIGRGYADVVSCGFGEKALDFDVIFGPAYKGILLAGIVSLGLYYFSGIDKPVSYNRKEQKDHGEGGSLIGVTLKDKSVLIVDDVMTAGTAAEEAVEFIRAHGGVPVGMVTILDRQEKAKDTEFSAVQQVERRHCFPVKSILTFADIRAYTRANQPQEIIQALEKYRTQYGVG